MEVLMIVSIKIGSPYSHSMCMTVQQVMVERCFWPWLSGCSERAHMQGSVGIGSPATLLLYGNTSLGYVSCAEQQLMF